MRLWKDFMGATVVLAVAACASESPEEAMTGRAVGCVVVDSAALSVEGVTLPDGLGVFAEIADEDEWRVGIPRPGGMIIVTIAAPDGAWPLQCEGVDFSTLNVTGGRVVLCRELPGASPATELAFEAIPPGEVVIVDHRPHGGIVVRAGEVEVVTTLRGIATAACK